LLLLAVAACCELLRAASYELLAAVATLLVLIPFLIFYISISVSWWKLYGTEVPNLQKMAMRILALTSSSSGCERNWSIYEMVIPSSLLSQFVLFLFIS
jgi:hypothetical protein